MTRKPPRDFGQQWDKAGPNDPANKVSRQSERDFQRAVMELAELSGWETLHVRTSMQKGRYMTATTGTMAKGWPDLVLAHPGRGRIIFAELKGDKGRLTTDQNRVIDVLHYAAPFDDVSVELWRPKDWDQIEATLTFRESRAA